MKKSDIEIGGSYLAKVSGRQIPVKVTGTVTTFDGKTEYDITRLDNGKKLSSRTSAAIHPINVEQRSNNERVVEMARRGRKAKAASAPYRVSRRVRTVSALRGFRGTPYSEAASYGPRRPRGRRPGSKNAAPVTVVVQENPFAGFTSNASSTNGRRRGRRPGTKNRKRGGLVRRTTSRVKNYFRKVKTMPRGRKSKGGAAVQTYQQVTGNLPIQVSQTVAEALFALGSVGIDVYTNSTASKADDLAFPVIEFSVATVGRYLGQKYLARKHPGLAATISSGFSAMNGDRIGTTIRGKLASFLQPSGPPASGPRGS